MESLLHYVWQHRLYEAAAPQTSDGQPFEILDTGIYNTNAGPDFFNAKIKIGDAVWAGNIEIHERSSDWQKHKHGKNKAYNSVILHVVGSMDLPEIRDKSGRIIPQWEMKIPQKVRDSYLFLVENDLPIPCLGRLGEISSIYLADWKTALLTERLERKANDILRLLAEYKNDWNEVFYITLARNFGFGINNDAFERLAKSLPLKIIHKNAIIPLQTEALFLGQAGLLDDDEIIDNYYGSLRKEYLFLKEKYGLQPLDEHIFKSLRIRPNNFPHIKLVQLAGILARRQGIFSELTEIKEESGISAFFKSEISDYWKTHYRFGKTSPQRDKQLGMSANRLLVINVAVPMFFAFGKKKNKPEFCDKALQILETTAAERNYIITQFTRAGLIPENAGDSQALIQLKREYCEKKKCIHCRIGHHLLAGSIVPIGTKCW
jgi:hypothetical protein